MVLHASENPGRPEELFDPRPNGPLLWRLRLVDLS